VRYSGETLDAVSTIKLLEAIKDIKNYALPSSDVSGGEGYHGLQPTAAATIASRRC